MSRKNPGFPAIVRPPNEFKSKKSDDLGWPDLSISALLGPLTAVSGSSCPYCSRWFDSGGNSPFWSKMPDVRFVPKADICNAAKNLSFDYLVDNRSSVVGNKPLMLGSYRACARK